MPNPSESLESACLVQAFSSYSFRDLSTNPTEACMSNTSIAALFGSYQLVSFIVSEISASIYSFRDRSVHPDRRTWLVILIKNIYTLWGRKRFLLHVRVGNASFYLLWGRKRFFCCYILSEESSLLFYSSSRICMPSPNIAQESACQVPTNL